MGEEDALLPEPLDDSSGAELVLVRLLLPPIRGVESKPMGVPELEPEDRGELLPRIGELLPSEGDVPLPIMGVAPVPIADDVLPLLMLGLLLPQPLLAVLELFRLCPGGEEEEDPAG
jgi:hypothetical protein